MATYAKEVEHLIVENNLDNIYLIGHSFGGAVVSAVVELVPERIKYQIYIDSFF